jgi:hypothetical protein
VETDTLNPEDIQKAVLKAGFIATAVWEIRIRCLTSSFFNQHSTFLMEQTKLFHLRVKLNKK